MKRYIESAIAYVKAARALSQDYYWQLVGSPFGKWIPAPNVLSGAVAAGLIALARKGGLLEVLPAGWSELVAGAFVTYWIGPPKFAGSLTLASDPLPIEEEIDDQLPASQDNTGLID